MVDKAKSMREEVRASLDAGLPEAAAPPEVPAEVEEIAEEELGDDSMFAYRLACFPSRGSASTAGAAGSS